MSERAILYSAAWNRFARFLESIGFKLVEHDCGRWEGDLAVEWEDPVTKEKRANTHRIAITLDFGFPFKKPEVVPLSELPDGIRHRAPLSHGGALCLYSERQNGWLPEFTAADLVARVEEWFRHYHRNDWDDSDRPPDLHLYYHRSKRRMLAVTSEDWAPPKGVSGLFAMWEGDFLVVVSNPTSGFIVPNAEAPENISSAIGVNTAGKAIGMWFRLSAEPTPAETLDRVLTDIDAKTGRGNGSAQAEIRHVAGAALSREFRTVLAVGYPGTDGAEQWLFLDVILPAGKRRSEKWERRLCEIRVRALETAPASGAALLRRTAHVQKLLNGKRVLIFGLGAIGSSVAVLLAKAGLSSLMGVDNGQLRPGNCIRHEAGLRQSGLTKSIATAIAIKRHAPYCEIKVEEESWDPNQLMKLASTCDLVIDATANESFGLLLNEVCIKVKKTLLSVAAYRRSSIGRVRVVRPHETSCIVCYREHLNDVSYPAIPLGDEGEFVEGGCGDPTVEASAIDIEFIANVASRTAIDLLTGKALPGTECTVVNSPIEKANHPLDIIGIHWATWVPVKGCEACGA